MSRRPTPEHRHVYVIGPKVGLQKVGIATDPRQRLATLQTACPFDLFLHLSVAVPFGDALAIERRAHRLLAKSCVRNEWFETTPAEAIAAVQLAVEPNSAVKPATPVEWQSKRRTVAPPDVTPLLSAGKRFRPQASFHKAPEPSPLPLFDYAQQASAAQAERVLVDRVVGVLLKRIGG